MLRPYVGPCEGAYAAVAWQSRISLHTVQPTTSRTLGKRRGDPKAGYYSYELGTWRVIVLNSECLDIGGCNAGSKEEQWLRADLAAHPQLVR